MNQGDLGEVEFKEWKCRAVLHRYKAGGPAIQLIETNNGHPVVTATANLPGLALTDQEVVVRGDKGLLEALVIAGIVAYTGKIVRIGYSFGYICRLVKSTRVLH